ncbi:MAG: hypothetical protein WD226_11740 [Planctomycetota bacterium]
MHRFLTLLLPLFLFSCSSVPATPDVGPQVGQRLVTLSNLHPDPARHKLSSLNYQQAGFIPVGSTVTITDRNRSKLTFKEEETGIEYTFERSKHTPNSLGENLTLFFGTPDQVPDASGLSEIDREGIQQGAALIGMTKTGVLIACGPPPIHATASTDLFVWTYWKNRWATRVVRFDSNGIVVRIDG